MHAIVADDERDLVYLVQTYLEGMGFKVTPAYNGKDALEMILHYKPDVVVLDIEMPQMNGLEVLKHLRSEPSTADLPVILLTARDELDDLFEGWNVGASMYITKPFIKKTLVDAVRAFTSAA